MSPINRAGLRRVHSTDSLEIRKPTEPAQKTPPPAKESSINSRAVYRRFTTTRHSATDLTIGPADEATGRIGQADGAKPETHATMPKPKSKRKTTRPSAPPARQAPRSPKLIRLAGETVAQGMDLVAADRPADALALTEAFLAKNRATADVLHLSGYAKVILERPQEALEDFRKAVKLEPDTPAYRNSLGIAAQMDGDHEQARRQFARACQLDGANPTYWFNLGNALRDLGTSAEAADAYEAALRHLPDDPEILNNLGIVLRDDGRVDEAVDIFRKARDLAGREPRILANLGIALMECADRDPDGEAEPLLKAAVAQSPDAERTEPLRALMQLYLWRGRGAQAVALARQLADRLSDDLTAQRSLAEALLNARMAEEASELAGVLCDQHPDNRDLALLHVRCLVEAHRYDEVMDLTDRLLAVSPGDLAVLRWRFEMLYWSDRSEQLATEFEQAKATYPDMHFAHLMESRLAFVENDLDLAIRCLNRYVEAGTAEGGILMELALNQIRAGYLTEGWGAYRRRHDSGAGTGSSSQGKEHNNASHPYLPIPIWHGEPLAGKRVFIMAEQGVGDEVMFGSCLPDLVAQAEHCIIECDPRLVPLYRRSFPESTIRPAIKSVDFSIFYRAYAWLGRPGGADVAVSAGDLPLYLRNSKSDFDVSAAFLKPRADRVDFWRRRFDEISGGRPVVGISWQGSLISSNRLTDYQNLETWAPMLRDAGFCMINLQSRRFKESIEAVQKSHGLAVAYWDDVDLHNDFDEAAAYIAALDAAIGPVTFTAQLAGAVGTRTFVPMSGQAWVCCGFPDRIPFYQQVKTFRRRPGSSWVPAMRSIVSELRATLHAGSTVPRGM